MKRYVKITSNLEKQSALNFVEVQKNFFKLKKQNKSGFIYSNREFLSTNIKECEKFNRLAGKTRNNVRSWGKKIHLKYIFPNIDRRKIFRSQKLLFFHKVSIHYYLDKWTKKKSYSAKFVLNETIPIDENQNWSFCRNFFQSGWIKPKSLHVSPNIKKIKKLQVITLESWLSEVRSFRSLNLKNKPRIIGE